MYSPNVEHPLLASFDMESMNALITGSNVRQETVSTFQQLSGYLKSLPGSSDNYVQDGIRGLLWVSSNVGNTIRNTIEAGKMSIPPRLPMSPFWSMLRHSWSNTMPNGGSYLGTIGGYGLVTGDANTSSSRVLMVAVPVTDDYSVIRGFVERILDFQIDPYFELSYAKNLFQQNGFASAYGMSKSLSAWGSTVDNASIAQLPLAMYRDEPQSVLRLLSYPGYPLQVHYGDEVVPEGSYLLGVKTSAAQGLADSLDIKIGSQSPLVVLSIAADEVTAQYTHTQVDTDSLYQFQDDEQVAVVLRVSWTASTLELQGYVATTTSYQQVLNFTGTRVVTDTDMKLQILYSVLTGGIASMSLKAVYLWPSTMTVGTAIDRLKRI